MSDDRPIGTILVPRRTGADAGVLLAADPLDVDAGGTTALVNRDGPPPRPGQLCVVQTPAGPLLRRVTRRGSRLLLRTRSGRFAGSAPAGERHLPVVYLMTPVR